MFAALLGLAAAVAALALVAFAGYWFVFVRPLPRACGSVTVSTIKDDVEITRDGFGRPRITATGWPDAAFAIGFAQGQDRLWQLELTRRTAAGRLSELLGASALASDRLMRRIGIARVSEAEWHVTHAASQVRPLLEAFSEGVNTAAGDRPLPAEFSILRFRPEPWQPADSLAALRLWSLDRRWMDQFGAGGVLPSHTIPSQAYEVAVAMPGEETTGQGLCGVPFVLSGRNQTVSWELAGASEVAQDLSTERFNPNNPMQYLDGDGWADALRYHEVIAVRGGAPVTENVLITRRGPIVGPALPGAPPSLALRWVALNSEVDSVSWLLRLNRARDWKTFRAAVASCPSPVRTVTYADTEGNRGRRRAGFVPIRGEDGDWHGFVALEEVPEAYGRVEEPAATAAPVTDSNPVDREYEHALTGRFPVLRPLLNRRATPGVSGHPASRHYVVGAEGRDRSDTFRLKAADRRRPNA